MVHCIVYSLWKRRVVKFLRVDVVKIIDAAFKQCGLPVMPVDELLTAVKDNKDVWNLYAKGFTQGLNQVERPKSTQRCMQYKPKNVEELSSFIAGIRPGFASMLNTFLNREHFEYGIPSLDNLLKTEAIPDSFLEFDEQLLIVLKAAGIPGPDAYAAIKAVKKKKRDKVLSYKERFKEGFAKKLIEEEGATPEKANEVVEEIWTILENSANYLFCSSHSFSMSCDSLYCAWLKAYHPYELYLTMLKLYDEKKNTDKISAIIDEMKRYKGITLLPGHWRQDNREWTADKDNHTISQSLSSIKYMSKGVAEDLYNLSQQENAFMGIEIIPGKLTAEAKNKQQTINKRIKILKEKCQEEENPLMSEEELNELRNEKEKALEEIDKLSDELEKIKLEPTSWATPVQEVQHCLKMDCFTNVLRAIQMNTCADTRQVKILIELGYFSEFGSSGKLMKVFDEFTEGKNKLTKTIKSFMQRLQLVREYEERLQESELPLRERLQSEQENIGLCLTTDQSQAEMIYFVRSIDSKYGTTVNLYSPLSGKSGNVRFRKADIERHPISEYQMIKILDGNRSPRYTLKGGERVPIPGETEYWVRKYQILKAG